MTKRTRNHPKTTYPKLDMGRIKQFVAWYKQLQASQKTGFMMAIVFLIIIPVVTILSVSISTKPLDLAPLEVIPAAHNPCVITGCANHLCQALTAPESASPCPILPHFQCLSLSRCELQPNGSCGWTETEPYNQCLKTLYH